VKQQWEYKHMPYLIQKADAKSNIDLHLLFLQLAGHAILDNDICRVLSRELRIAKLEATSKLTAPSL
jgi:hypothetical protein